MASTLTPASLTDRRSDETRAFFQARIGKYLLIYGCVGGSFLLLRVLASLLTSDGLRTELTHPSFAPHAAGVAFSLGGWLFVRRGRLSVDVLESVETFALFASMSAYAVMGYFMPPLFAPQDTVMLALGLGLFARAIYVPSTARRSLLLALAVAVPHLLITANAPFRVPSNPVELEATQAFTRAVSILSRKEIVPAELAAMTTLNLALWWVGTIVLTTSASQVIYNLRAEVRDVKQLGQYKLEEKLGQGGMGIVYRASHAMLQRATAVKLLPAELVGEHSLARFEREVRLTARLTHPNTVTIFDYGRTPEGVFYYAMELLAGENLADFSRQHGALAPSRVVHILRQVCGSLREAHAVGLIHRDIKPANIMLCERGGVYDTVKVLDFGLVKELDRSAGAHLTQANVVTGTPQYMPPEALTAPDSIDGRSDLYSLGAVAFLLLTGEDLFDGATVVEICSHHLHTAPRRCSEVLPSVPTDLELVVASCLSKKPGDRPQSAQELDDALAACACAGGWTTRDAAQWWSDHPSATSS